MAEWEKVTSYEQIIRRMTTQVSRARGLAKIKDPENCDGKSQKWRDPITFDQWEQRIIKWLQWQEYDILSEEALDRASFLLIDNAEIWYDEYQREPQPKNRNTYSFLCLLRNKLIPTISKDVLWNQYNSCHHAQLGEPGKLAPVNQYAQKLEEYRMRCIDTDGEKMVSLQAMKMKFVDGLIPLLREKVRPLIDWDMPFDEIVSIAEKIQTTTRLTAPQQPMQKQKQFRQWS